MGVAVRREDARRLLGVGPGATLAEVERAFRRRVRTTHPDRGGDPAQFRQLVAARAALTGGSRVPVSATRLVVRHSRVRRLTRALRARLPWAPAPRVR